MTARTPCARIRELLLEAEPDELRGLGTSAVAEHVRACDVCAGLARRILEETEALAAYLDEPGDPPIEAILRRVGVTPAPGAASRARSRRWLWAPAAAAAAVAALFLLEMRGPHPTWSPPAAASTPAPVVEPVTDGTVAVIQTDNPDITVLWFFR